MQNSPQPIVKDLVLIGGGHSHAIALKSFGMNPLPGVRITLITDVSHTPYSGMLPGYIAGLYHYDDCHIDLRPLANFAQAHMMVDRAIGLDLEHNRVICANHPAIAFDVLSIDIGSTPTASPVPGALKYATPVKPISQFLAYWDELVQNVRRSPEQPLRLAIVGGGAGGVELTLSAQAHLSRIYQQAGQPATHLEMHLFHRGNQLLPGRNAWVGKRLEKMLTRRGVQVHLNEEVSEIQPDLIQCRSGLSVECDRVFWVTQASAAPWLQASGLATTDQGFVQVSDTLQSTSHPHIFAAGDVATMVNHPRPKAGVFAVRQGKPLVQNLRRALLSQSPKPFTPQKQFLILVGTGNGAAIASRGLFHLGPHPLIWQWKDRIDRQFMNQFSDLTPMAAVEPGSTGDTPPTPSMYCSGCASKVGSTVLERALHRVKQDSLGWIDRDDILIGLDAPDDAAVVSVPPGEVMVQTVDYFRALINDPFLLGQIVTNHCLSDIFAMGAVPQSVMAIATLPHATEAKLEETLYQLLSGAMKVLGQVNAPLIGGHTTEGTELAFGLACNGLVRPEHLWRKGGMQPGHSLILTKGLGTGTLFAADMRLKAKGRWIEQAIQSMLLSNQAAADCLRQHQVTSCTDVTGFGLLGHLVEMVRASQVAVELDLDALPVLAGAREMVEQGILSSLHPQNERSATSIENREQVRDRPLYPLLFDPQTSGGLLASLPADQANGCIAALQAKGHYHSRIIGRVLPHRPGQPPVRIG
ncbi:selenide, water dikinase SelD [Oculatella sp. LEGE 06141]|uniref:selenide, water dikinase SelD n=1 Tax=Oculatella sp. LEGE 06141 TaxID=1828648 RepID=UPI00188169B8|nr:selenide, water dikinase SelD [Oculatella sp. LEGE 06141]MBE9178445.1 selenide, water dikinase SelD [Oculatella sp. LEGE 06141]